MTLPNTTALADDLPKPCLLLAPKTGAVVWSNQSAQEHFGLSARRLKDSTLASLFPELPDGETLLARVAEEGATIVIRDIQHGGQSAEVTVFSSLGQVGLLLTFERSFTSRAVQGRSVRSMGQMIGHEIKNPLAGIKGAAQLLRDDLDIDGKALVDVITSEIDRIRRLAERLETFGEADISSRSRANVHTLMRSARTIMTHASPNVVFTEDYDPSLPHVLGDEDQLMQALVNLLKNSIEAMGEEGGEIILKTRSRSGARRGRVGLPVEVQVIDTGPGIPKAMQGRVFEPFVTTKPSGQGLGLAWVAKVAEAHGGLVELSSKPGNTRFSILLPAHQEPAHEL